MAICPKSTAKNQSDQMLSYARLLESTQEAIILTDPAGRIQLASGAAADIVGMEAGSMQGRLFHTLCTPLRS